MNRRFLDDLSLAMADVYAAVTDQLLVNLARHFKLIKGGKVPGSWDYQVRKLAEMGQVTKESRDIILKILGDADGALKNVLEQAIMDGLKDADPILQKAAEKGFITGVASGLAPNQMQAFQMYYQQSADKLNLVNTVMLESTQQAYQSTVADIVSKIDTTQKILNTATGEIIAGVDPFNKVLRQSVRKMVNNGLTGFIDHGGHHWSPEAYVAMDMRTTMTNTAREAVAERSREMGCDLYQVSSHNGARPLCYPWQGKVISRNGWTGVVEDFDGNKITVHSEDEIESFRYGGGLFGVNCGHYPIPFVPGFSRSRPPQQDEEANAKEYSESQEQRRLERELRGEKRELAVMKAQGATEEEITAQKARITQANNNLDSFCDSTGRARRRGREYTPINATFPPDDSYDVTKFGREQQTRIREFYRNGGNQQNNIGYNAEPSLQQNNVFTPAKTRAEAEAYAQERFAGIVDFGGISLENANKINEMLTELTRKYPINKLDHLTQQSQGSVARARHDRLEINGRKLGKILNDEEAIFKANQESIKEEVAFIRNRYAGKTKLPFSAEMKIKQLESKLKYSRYGVQSSYEDHVKVLITHEYGHILSDQYFGMINAERANPNYSLNWGLRGMNDKWKLAFEKAIGNGDIYTLSEYGSKNVKEFFAESFAARVMGEKLPDYVESLLDEVLTNGIM